MTISSASGAEIDSSQAEDVPFTHDHRGSWVPTGQMIATRFMELRKRRGLMVALIMVFIGIPTIFLTIRLLAHAFAPHSFGPAGGYDIFTSLVGGVMYVFGFIVAATLGCTAGSVDLTEGMFRHLVITGRSRVALYFARIPAGLAIVVPLVAAGFTIVCAVCVFGAPTKLSYEGVNVPPGLSRSGFETWAMNHSKAVICDLPYNESISVVVKCGTGPGVYAGPIGKTLTRTPTQNPSLTELQATAIKIASADYTDYTKVFLSPSVSLMIETGLWIELEAAIGFIVGLGLASLMGQRTVPVILMIVLEIVLTPIFSRAEIPHLVNLQRGLVGLAMDHLAPSALRSGVGGGPGGQGGSALLSESTTVAAFVIVGWLVVWTALGTWRMVHRDA